MKRDVPLEAADMDDQQYLQADEVDEEIEIIDENELNEINELDLNDMPVDEQDDEQEDDVLDEDLATENEPPEESAKLVYTKHKESVLCIGLSKKGDLVMSGGQDDISYVWRTENGELLFECAEHKDSVVCVGFSAAEKHVASGDMSGYVQVRKLPCGTKVWEYEMDDLNWLQWHPTLDAVLICGTATGTSWLFDIYDQSRVKIFQGPDSASTCGKILGCGKRAVMGYDDGSVRLWDLKAATASFTMKDKMAHNGSVTCVDVKPDDSLVASGSVDETVKLINVSTGRIVHTFECGKEDRTAIAAAAAAAASSNAQNDEEESSVESVAFSSDMPTLATATVKGVVEIWDLSTFICRIKIKSNAGISKIKYDHIEPHLLHASCLDGSLMTFDSRSGQLIATQYGHRDQILDFDISRASSLAVTASEDTSCRVFDLRQKEKQQHQ